MNLLLLTAAAAAVIAVLGLFFVLYALIICIVGADRIRLPGQSRPVWDDMELLVADEEAYLPTLSPSDQQAYFHAQQWIHTHPPALTGREISVDDYASIQQQGVQAWEFIPNGSASVVNSTEIEFRNETCDTLTTNLPLPSVKDVYYFETKLYSIPNGSKLAVGLATQPYPSFRLPGMHKYSVSYESTGHSRINSSFRAAKFGKPWQRGDVIGCGFETRKGTIFFTHNGKKMGEVVNGMKLNLFPVIGCIGKSTVHVNLGHAGYVFIQANVKDWGFAPKEGVMDPPPTYLEAPSTLLLDVWSDAPPYRTRSCSASECGSEAENDQVSETSELDSDFQSGASTTTDSSTDHTIHTPHTEPVSECSSTSHDNDND